ncbi:hypothetical protein HAX54_044108, partial [Datura stramonium]|nr:hypothetical protein [Datura stramonium]
MCISDSSVGYAETPMECRFGLILALGHCLDPALHWQFTNKDRRFTTLSLIKYLLPQLFVSHRRFSGSPRIPFCGSPVFSQSC